MKTSENIDEITLALTKFQADVEHPKKDTEGYGYKYAPLETVINTIKPTLKDHGLAVTQSTISEGERIGVKTILWHKSGQFIEFDKLTLPSDDGQQRSGAQAAGSSITYARRYALSAALGIASEEDTDAAPKRKSKSRQHKSTSSNNNLTIADIQQAVEEKEQQWSESAFADAPTDGQLGKFNAFWGENIEGNDNDRYRFLNKVTGRKIESSKDLLKGEISALIELTANNTMEFVAIANKFVTGDTEEMFE